MNKNQTLFEKFEAFERKESKSLKIKSKKENTLTETYMKNRKNSNHLNSQGSTNSSKGFSQKKKEKQSKKQQNKKGVRISDKKQIQEFEDLIQEIDENDFPEPFIGNIQQIPKFMRDNEHIKTGYRIGFNTSKKILRSLFMVHNESVNVWSHLIGAIFFICLILYTSLYCAPPGLSEKSIRLQRWFADHNMTNTKNQALLNELLNKKVSLNLTGSSSSDVEIENLNLSDYDEVLKEALKSELLQELHEEADYHHNHPEASIFESIELYLSQAIHTIADPQSYVGCLDSLERFTKVIRSIPSHLDEQIASTMEKVNDYKVYQHKLDYLKSLVNYLEQRIISWEQELEELVNSPGFDFLELKPIFEEPHQLVHYVNRFPLFIHMLGAICCLGCSALFHLFKEHSEKVCRSLNRVDYAGISVMIAASNTPPIYYSFFCEDLHAYRALYLGLMYFFCFSSFVVLLVPKFDQPKFRPLRGILFIICGLLSSVPIFHINVLEKKYLNGFTAFPWALGGALYIGGACMYMMKIPERFFPGKFDIVGSSHQLFHFLIVTAALVHYRASIYVFHDRQLYQCPVTALENFNTR